MAISSISSLPVRPVAPLESTAPSKTTGAGGASFGSVFENAIGRMEQMRGQADDAVQKLLTGEGGELHTAALAAQRAEVAFDLGLQVRNKIVSAYQEVMRMQL
jgi:flagellar hook-basal body complex protein FliE